VATVQPIWIEGLDGLRKTDAAPIFVAAGGYVDKAGSARTPPAVPVHIGEGQYTFAPSDADEAAGTIAIVDCGVDSFPRYQYVAIFTEANPFALFVPFDIAGNLSAGAPTVASFRELDNGAARTPPAVVKAGSFERYTATPTAGDCLVGVGLSFSSPSIDVYPLVLGASFYPPSGGSSGAPPVVTLVSPVPGPIPVSQMLVVSVTAALGLRFVEISVTFPGMAVDEVIYRTGAGLAFKYRDPPNAVTSIPGGISVAFRRSGYWPADFKVDVDAIDTIGQAA
jgi:hypothetical protein